MNLAELKAAIEEVESIISFPLEDIEVFLGEDVNCSTKCELRKLGGENPYFNIEEE